MTLMVTTNFAHYTEQVHPEEGKLEWKEMTDRAANTAFMIELSKGMYFCSESHNVLCNFLHFR